MGLLYLLIVRWAIPLVHMKCRGREVKHDNGARSIKDLQ